MSEENAEGDERKRSWKMSSVIRDRNGRKRIGFTAADGTRKTLRLGKATLRQAEAVKVRIEQLTLA